ncbi:MAG: hypothetical protein L3J10_02975 [Sulfurimonas sp.]|nr:hypothetical protein [Sulfurimonas sp.]
MILLKRTYPFSASKTTRQKTTKERYMISSFLRALEKYINKTAKKGGKYKYMLLSAVYAKNKITYINVIKVFLLEILRCI